MQSRLNLADDDLATILRYKYDKEKCAFAKHISHLLEVTFIVAIRLVPFHLSCWPRLFILVSTFAPASNLCTVGTPPVKRDRLQQMECHRNNFHRLSAQVVGHRYLHVNPSFAVSYQIETNLCFIQFSSVVSLCSLFVASTAA